MAEFVILSTGNLTAPVLMVLAENTVNVRMFGDLFKIKFRMETRKVSKRKHPDKKVKKQLSPPNT